MASLDDFAPHVAPFAPGCPTITVGLHMRVAMADFCAFTKCWRHTAVVNDLVPASRVVVPVPAGTVIAGIERAWHDGRELEPRPWSSFDPQQLGCVGAPSFITQARPKEVTLVPRAESGQLTLSLFLKPGGTPSGRTSQPASVYDPEVYDDVYSDTYAPIPGELEIPDHILEEYGAMIAHGALARLLLIPNQTWTDPASANAHRQLFRQAMDEVQGADIRGQQRAPLRQRPSYF